MQAEQLYRIRFSETHGPGRSSRVGLLHGRTGVPLFLLYLESISRPIEFECNSLEGLEVFASQFTSVADRQAVLGLRLFFEEGGALAQIVASPLSRRTEKSILEQMLGTSMGFNQRSGLFLLKNATEHADLIAVPQARTLLTPEEHTQFLDQLFSRVSDASALFALVETPRGLDTAQAIQWTKVLTCSDAAVYFPGLVQSRGQETSVLPAIAGLYQITDSAKGVSELPTMNPFQSDAVPSLKLTPSQQMELLAGRINSIVFTPGAGLQVRTWGGHTLARPPEMEFSLIPVRRTLRAVREALETIAESFVLEPISADSVMEIEYRVRGFLDEHRNLFDLYTKTPFEISATSIKGRDSDGVEINCSFRLSRCVQELRLSLGVSQ